jgi:hypothetical protein
MSDSNPSTNPSPQPIVQVAPASNFSTNAILLFGILAICGSILYVGQAPKDEPAATAEQMTLGDDFWMKLPPEVADLRDRLATESQKLSELNGTVEDKVAKAESLDEGPELDKLNEEIEAVLGEQQKKVRELQRDFVRRINGLRTTYIVQKVNKK